MKYIFPLLKNVLPVQRAAARTLCIYLRYNRKQEQRYEVIQKLIERKSSCPLYHEEVSGILVKTRATVYKRGRLLWMREEGPHFYHRIDFFHDKDFSCISFKYLYASLP